MIHQLEAVRTEMTKLSSDMLTNKNIMSEYLDDYPKHIPRYIINKISKQREQIRQWSCKIIYLEAEIRELLILENKRGD
jgi:hypothetical protein